MRRLLATGTVALSLAATAASAVTTEYRDYVEDFDTFSHVIAPALALAATPGLEWSSSYLGAFPSFGVGVALAATTLPFGPSAGLLEQYGGPGAVDKVAIFRDWGFPLPAPAVEARVGGVLLPFHVGILPDIKGLLTAAGVMAELRYGAFGLDVRLQLVEERGSLLSASAGVGYERLVGGLTVFDTKTDIALKSFTPPIGIPVDLEVQNAAIIFEWAANVLFAKVQASESLGFVTPYVGMQFLGAHRRWVRE